MRGCPVSRRYIHICKRDMFSAVNMYHDHLGFYVTCINGVVVCHNQVRRQVSQGSRCRGS